ncbi:MAG: uroporphyrinogen decarboxylase family protein [Dehalococcoidia bacterium]|nr:uroporphyrinogen decarboxylase family protein [Dehalococcoidia bacterium]
MNAQHLSIPERVRTAVSLQEPDQVPVGLLVLAPVFQEFAGISGEDYFHDKDKMLSAQLSFHRRFPQAIPISGIRPDYGPSVMASGFGFRLEWLASGPRLDLSSRSIEDIEPADPYRDGLMPRALEEMAYFVEHTDDELKESHGNTLWVSFTLGPLQSIAELVGYREIYSRILRDPQWMHRMCEVQTITSIAWVKAQEETLRQAGVSPGRLFLADETVGLVSEDHLREFFLPYVQRIYAASQAEVKCFHADEDVTHIPGILLEMGANLYNFNFSAVARLKRLIGHRMCLEGNLESVGVLAAGTPTQIQEGVREIIMRGGAGGGLIISTGGGISTGTPPENIEIMIAATQRFGRYPLPFETNLAQAPPAVPRRVTAVREAASPTADPLVQLSDLVANGKVEDVVEAVGRLLKAGQEPRSILLEGLSKGLQSIAHLYYRKRAFMPEMVMASAAFQQGFEFLEPHLDATDEGGSIVIGAVQGNVQESGILLVGAMLRGAGFLVYNLGINVTPQRFMEEALANNAAIVAIGVYTRDRLAVVKEIARLARSKGLRTLVGGRGINREQSSEAGVDAYGEDGYDAIQQATELVRR